MSADILGIMVDDPDDILGNPIYEGLVSQAYKSLKPGNYDGLIYRGNLDDEEEEIPMVLVVTETESHVVEPNS